MSDAVTPFQAPIGTHDVLAPSSAEWEGVIATFAQFAYRYGFELVITPMFEDVGVFNRGIGEESEMATKEIAVLHRPRQPHLRASSRGDRVGRAGLHSARSDDAVEGVVLRRGLSLRTSPEGPLSPAQPIRRRSARHR